MIYLGPNPDIITQFGIPVSPYKTRQVCDGDFYSFTHILVADNSNIRVNALLCEKPHDSTAEVKLWGPYFDDEPIPDPFCGDIVSSSWGVV